MILIVDDNSDMRQVLCQYLASISSDSEVLECADGKDAVSMYAQHKPDLVLMDIVMKDVDGLCATARIKEQYPDAKIVIVTNFDDFFLRQEAHAVGAVGFVPKGRLWELKKYVNNC
jgi:NarL family two-component system response regulator LiaR